MSSFLTSFARQRTKSVVGYSARAKTAYLIRKARSSVEKRMALPLAYGHWPAALDVLRFRYTKLGVMPKHYESLIRECVERDGMKARELVDFCRDACKSDEIPNSISLFSSLCWAYCQLRDPEAAVDVLQACESRWGLSAATKESLAMIILKACAECGCGAVAEHLMHDYVPPSKHNNKDARKCVFAALVRGHDWANALKYDDGMTSGTGEEDALLRNILGTDAGMAGNSRVALAAAQAVRIEDLSTSLQRAVLNAFGAEGAVQQAFDFFVDVVVKQCCMAASESVDSQCVELLFALLNETKAYHQIDLILEKLNAAKLKLPEGSNIVHSALMKSAAASGKWSIAVENAKKISLPAAVSRRTSADRMAADSLAEVASSAPQEFREELMSVFKKCMPIGGSSRWRVFAEDRLTPSSTRPARASYFRIPKQPLLDPYAHALLQPPAVFRGDPNGDPRQAPLDYTDFASGVVLLRPGLFEGVPLHKPHSAHIVIVAEGNAGASQPVPFVEPPSEQRPRASHTSEGVEPSFLAVVAAGPAHLLSFRFQFPFSIRHLSEEHEHSTMSSVVFFFLVCVCVMVPQASKN